MNKNLRKVVAIALTVSAVSAAAPASASNYNLLSTKAYASSDDTELSSLKIKTSSGSTIKMYSDDDYKSKNQIDSDQVDTSETIYAQTDSNKIKISTEGPSTSKIRVFTGTGSTKGTKTSSSISLDKGTNTIYVRVYEEDPGTVKYKDDDVNVESEYTIKIKCKSDSSSDDNNDDIYLDNISLSEGDINFSKSTNSYNVKVSSSVDQITVKAEPNDTEEDEVRINGSIVNEDDRWKKTVDLDKGKNKITITVEDDDNKRSYTLYVTRGESSNTSDKIYLDNLKVGSTALTLKEDVKDYNLSVKSSVDKISIFADPKDVDYKVTIDGTEVDNSDDFKKSIELEEDKVNTVKVKVKNTSGTEQTYTINIGRGNVPASSYPVINGNNVNSLNNNNNANVSANKNKWVQTGSSWQYFDGMGTAVKDTWVGNYYLDSDSYMLANTWKNISNAWYYFDGSGAKHTGWLLSGGEWYYLNSDGRMATGWFKDFDGQWYYLQGSGAMAKNTTINGYRLGSNGAWIR